MSKPITITIVVHNPTESTFEDISDLVVPFAEREGLDVEAWGEVGLPSQEEE